MLFAFLTMKKASLPLAGGGRRAWLEPDVVHVEREAAGGVGDKAVGEPLPIVPLVYYVGDWLAPNHRLDVNVIHPVLRRLKGGVKVVNGYGEVVCRKGEPPPHVFFRKGIGTVGGLRNVERDGVHGE